MTEWLLSGHNPQENLGLTRPVVATVTEQRLHDQIQWFLEQLAGGPEAFDLALRASTFVQGRWYLNINYFVRNMGVVGPFDAQSLGVPQKVAQKLVAEVQVPKLSVGQRLLLLPRFLRLYRWMTDFHRHTLPSLHEQLKKVYWQLRREPDDPLALIWPLFAPGDYEQMCDTRPNLALALVVTSLDSLLRQRAPQLIGLFAGQGTAISLIGQRTWDLAQTAKRCGDEVRQMLEEGVADLDAYRALPQAAPFVAAVEEFLYLYGHRGFRYEFDWQTDRLADRPGYLLLAVAGQLDVPSPEERAQAAQQMGLEALAAMKPWQRPIWRRVLRWAQQLISWREESKTHVALFQAVYGLAARGLGHHFYPDQPDDTLMFYTMDEFLAFVRSRGEERVDLETLHWRRAQFELHQSQSPPPELIWFDPDTGHWRPAVQAEAEEGEPMPVSRLEGIAASSGCGPVEGLALVTNDPLEAGRRLLEMDGPVVLVTRLTDPAWSGLFPRLSAVVTELGGVISHAAIVARENGLPAVVGIPDITQLVRDGQRLRVDGGAGVVEVLA